MSYQQPQFHPPAYGPPPPHSSPASGRPRWLVPVIVVASVVLLAVIGTVVIVSRSGGVTIKGTLRLFDLGEFTPSVGSCAGHGGYSDIRAGAQVVITDAEANTIALGSLGLGKPDGSSFCVFPFTVQDVPGRSYYGVEVSHRGRVQYSRGDVGKELALTLGS